MLNSPAEVEESSRAVQTHEVVAQVEVCDVLAVEEILGNFLQTVAGQIHQTDSLRHHLQNTHLINILLFTCMTQSLTM